MKVLIKICYASGFMILLACGSKKKKEATSQKQTLQTTNLLKTNFFQEYSISSVVYGTQTTVIIKEGKRQIKTNALPNHETGKFPSKGNPNTIRAQKLNYSFPLNPKFSGKPKWAREPGIAINGVKFEPETAERFVCETGEVYKIEAFQNLINLGLDFNNAHVQPTGAYHYHGVPTELIKILDKGQDLIHIGFAKDGFPIYYSKKGKYKPSFQLSTKNRTGDACEYKNPKHGMEKELQNTRPDGTFVSDWEYIHGLGELDECNGMEVNGSYAYFITEEYPYMSRCLKGIFTEKHRKGPPAGQHRHNIPRGDHPHDGRPHNH